MAGAFRKMFWGYVFIFLEIHIIVDLFADPIGYGLIFSGISTFAKEFPISIKSRILSQALVWISLPTVIIQGEASQQAFGQPAALTGWKVYFTSLHLLNIILVFYLCKLLIEVAKKHEVESLAKSTSNTLKGYLVVMFGAQLFSAFAINLPLNKIEVLFFVVIGASLIMHIVFLSLLHRHKKWAIGL